MDQGTKKINETHWFSDAYENVMLTFDAKLIQYVDEFIEEEFKSVYEEFGV